MAVSLQEPRAPSIQFESIRRTMTSRFMGWFWYRSFTMRLWGPFSFFTIVVIGLGRVTLPDGGKSNHHQAFRCRLTLQGQSWKFYIHVLIGSENVAKVATLTWLHPWYPHSCILDSTISVGGFNPFRYYSQWANGETKTMIETLPGVTLWQVTFWHHSKKPCGCIYHHSQKARGPPQEAGGGGYLRDFEQIGVKVSINGCFRWREIIWRNQAKEGLQRNQEISG